MTIIMTPKNSAAGSRRHFLGKTECWRVCISVVMIKGMCELTIIFASGEGDR